MAVIISLTSFLTYALETKRIDYEGFTAWLNCNKRRAVKFQFNAEHSTGSFKRYKLTPEFLHHANNP